MDRVSRIVLASVLIASAILGTAVVSNMSWMPFIYPTSVTYPKQIEPEKASIRVTVKDNATLSAFDYDTGAGEWTSQPFLLNKGETVTVEIDVTPRPREPSGLSHGVYFGIDRGLGSHIFDVWYGPAGMGPLTPNECIVPETGQYRVVIANYEPFTKERVSFKLTVLSTIVVAAPSIESVPVAPYGKAQTLMMLWLLLGVGMLVGAACALLIRPKQVAAQPPLSQVAEVERRLEVKFCRECGAKIPSESESCENCGAEFI